ncbi:hypothetical protein CHS0354_043147 [Potamilus streckersoni]|uniref:[heparan sulfate]-glucosamine N-sulfotransferase n=1 Tax=Potamilus streckersoni TaxID=2493646 RepID=A0AAE0VTV6_9BIVA|nr:hypothetical protein CHS0354_043147 [Potamilus streckersoni]
MSLRRHFENIKNVACRILLKRRCTLRKVLAIVLIFSVVSFVILNYCYFHSSKYTKIPSLPPVPNIRCRLDKDLGLFDQMARNHDTPGSVRIGKRVLVLLETPYTKSAKKIMAALSAARFEYKVEDTGGKLPALTHFEKGRFGVVIFEHLQSYVNMAYWNRQLVDKYCRDFDVGMIFFVSSPDEFGIEFERIPDYPLLLQYNLAIKNYRLNMVSDVWRIIRPGELIEERMPDDDWTVFHPNHTAFEPLAYAQIAEPFYKNASPGYDVINRTLITALLDTGKIDGIKKILFGNNLKFWLHHPLLLDSISYLSHGKLSLPLERYIQVDVDDVFVGAIGTRIKAKDVEAMVQTQERLQHKVEGFHFMLGFSGWYFYHGDDAENEGDKKILEEKDKFWWFGHMWRHEQPHKFDQDYLEKSMSNNLEFAKEKGISVVHQYAVSPHHSGVYPVHEPLYNVWKKTWDIRVTSTEEYPKLHPFYIRRGFIHQGIMVLPRQTCGLYTHTIYIDEYPGGREHLDDSIKGGELFQSFLYNPINVFMTHQSNYANDRLALYTFESAIKFVQCWTNLQLKQVPPLELAIKYFEMYPEEKTPIWKNPCDYKRHQSIWSANKTCKRLPKFLVIGPQKTGTTALYTFLGMHPAIKSNYNSQETFEEVQFFNGNNYEKGLDWYMDHFPNLTNDSTDLLFEKSATYFDNADAPMRAFALLPKTKIISILVDPAKRAYSWYQHMRAHTDPTALNYTFYDILTAPDTAPRRVRGLRNRCLEPGLYAQHILHWLDYFPAQQLFVIDGELLKANPVLVMDQVQKFLTVEPYFNYTEHLRFDPKKGFYCQVLTDDRNKCLGMSKGRQYPPMDVKSGEFLKQFYSKPNLALSKLLTKLNFHLPKWLDESLGA